jgi:GT2 family glycosyltransferase
MTAMPASLEERGTATTRRNRVPVTILVASRNVLPLLQRLAADIDGLEGMPVEMVVADGGSTDGTVEWLAHRSPPGGEAAMRWLSQPDDGIAQAWNRGLDLARGAWILFMGADDRLGDRQAWAEVLAALEAAPPTLSLAAFPVRCVTRAGTVLGVRSPQLGPRNRSIEAVNTVPHQGLFHRRELFSQVGRFDESFHVVADYELVLRALARGLSLATHGVPIPAAMTFGGLSSHNPLRNVLEMRRAQRVHGVRGLRLAWWAAAARAVSRSVVQRLVGGATACRLADIARRLRGLAPVWTIE